MQGNYPERQNVRALFNREQIHDAKVCQFIWKNQVLQYFGMQRGAGLNPEVAHSLTSVHIKEYHGKIKAGASSESSICLPHFTAQYETPIKQITPKSKFPYGRRWLHRF